jgi:arylsulfatase A-like enzyme
VDDLGRRITIGFTAGVLAGLVDLYIGLIVDPNVAIFEHYKLLSLLVFLSISPFAFTGLAIALLFHIAKRLPYIKNRTFFSADYITVLTLALTFVISARCLLAVNAHYLLYGSLRAAAHILIVMLLFAPVTYGVNKLTVLITRALKLRPRVFRRALLIPLTVLLLLPTSYSIFRAFPDLLRPNDQPFICFILIDTLRADHCSFYGYERGTTPYIDRTAERGTVFEDCQSQAPWTKPSVATIYTGLPASGHNVEMIFDSLPDEAITIAEVLKANGYITIGDSANYHITPRFDFDQGFDFFAVGATPVAFTDGAVGAAIFDKTFRYFRAKPGKEPARYAVRRASFILRYLNNDPIFLYMHFMEPHEPYTPSRRFKDAFGPPIDSVRLRPKRVHMEVEFVGDPEVTLDLTESEVQELIRRYDCEILQCDYAVGELVDGLERERYLDDSLVIITSDHGEEFMEHGFLYHARALYRESIHVPLIIVDSRENDPTPRVSEPVALADLTPTIYEWAGVSPPTEVATDFYGLSLIPAMDDDRLPPDRLLISEINRDVYSGTVWDPSKVGAPVGYLIAESIIGPDYKLIRDHNNDRDFVFDVKRDLHEQNPLAEKPGECTEMEKALDETIEFYEEKNLKSETGAIDEESWRKMRDMGYVH